MKTTIEKIISQYGARVLLEENRFEAIVVDLSPQEASLERKIVRRMAQAHLLQELYREVFADLSVREQGTLKVLVRMSEEGFTKEWASVALSIFGLNKDLVNQIFSQTDSVQSKYEHASSNAEQPLSVLTSSNPVIAEHLRHGFFSLDENEWDDAQTWFQKAISIDSTTAEAYIGLVLAEEQLGDLSLLEDRCHKYGLPCSRNWDNAVRYANGDLRRWIDLLLEEDNQRHAVAEQVRKAFEKWIQSKNRPKASELLENEVKRHRELDNLLNAFDTLIEEESKITVEAQALEEQSSQLQARKSQLGIFKGKEKRSIDAELSSLVQRKATLKHSSEEVSRKKSGFQSKVELEQAIEQSLSTIRKLEQQVKDESEQQGMSFEKALKLFRETYPIRRIVNSQDPTLGIKVDLSLGAATVTIGSYWQSANEHILSPIEWIILKNTGKRLLVISKYCLDAMPFNTPRADFTWETCGLRKWLNNDFFNEAFSAKEQALIPLVNVPAVNNDIGHAQAGRSTNDRVFVLNVPEAESYFSNDQARACDGTDYCFKKGADRGDNGKADWWLRTPGGIQSTATSVTSTGYVASGGHFGDHPKTAVRPAMWLDIEQ